MCTYVHIHIYLIFLRFRENLKINIATIKEKIRIGKSTTEKKKKINNDTTEKIGLLRDELKD